jgi:hypothetical protein
MSLKIIIVLAGASAIVCQLFPRPRNFKDYQFEIISARRQHVSGRPSKFIDHFS